ncbi:hypothetical protein [Escherichia coli]|uniref:hypothetical protein n=1 Tax=Escherichia coli TaxID=562 RepID=UPI00101D0D25|nr:hypothetical protein [Escherichia coli]RYH91540.1 hypothetical protein EVY45_23435 [Escherichia coli]
MITEFKYIQLIASESGPYLFAVIMVFGIGAVFGFAMSSLVKNFFAKAVVITFSLTVAVFMFIGFLSPKSTYEEMVNKKNNIDYVLKNCKVDALDAQQGGLLGVDKDAWSCPDGVTRYIPTKYRR